MKVIIGTALACLAVVFLLRYERADPYEEQDKPKGTLAYLAEKATEMVETSVASIDESSFRQSYCNSNAIVDSWKGPSSFERGHEVVSFDEVIAEMPVEYRSLIKSIDSTPIISSEDSILELVPFEPTREFRMWETGVAFTWELGEGASGIQLEIGSYKGCISSISIGLYATNDLYMRDTNLSNEP